MSESEHISWVALVLAELPIVALGVVMVVVGRLLDSQYDKYMSENEYGKIYEGE